MKLTIASKQTEKIPQTVILVKGWTGTKSCPLDSKPHHVNISCKKTLTVREVVYVYSKCKNESIIGTEQVCECEWNDKEKSDPLS